MTVDRSGREAGREASSRRKGRALRFYRSPHPGTDLPWHAWDDLQLCLDLPEDMRADFRRCLVADWAADVRTVATADGIVTIAPNWMAQGLVAAIEEARGTGPVLTLAYQQALFSAWSVLTGDMPAAASMELLSVALCNSLAQQGGSP